MTMMVLFKLYQHNPTAITKKSQNYGVFVRKRLVVLRIMKTFTFFKWGNYFFKYLAAA